MKNEWFIADKRGLATIVRGRGGKLMVLRELIQNGWDADGVTKLVIDIDEDGMTVTDNAPKGFNDLSHSYTMFAPSDKRSDPTKRGIFNLGEKQALSLCKSATVMSTTGTIYFKEDGTRRSSTREKDRTKVGTEVRLNMRISKVDRKELLVFANTLIPPSGIETVVNGKVLADRECAASINDLTLETVIYSEEKDALAPSRRKTNIEIYEVPDGEVATLYEMGIPVVETGDQYHVNVDQRVPLNVDRDNVKPSYMQDIRAHVLNRMACEMEADDFSEPWVADAMGDNELRLDVLKKVIEKTHGKDAIVVAPGDTHGKEEAISRGLPIISSRALPKGVMERAREAGAVTSSSVRFPSAKVGFELIDRRNWTDAMYFIANLTKFIARECAGFDVDVKMIKSPKASTCADYGDRTVRFNVSLLGKGWFDQRWSESVLDLIIHELGHEGGGHVDMGYHKMITRIGARLACLIVSEPKKIKEFLE